MAKKDSSKLSGKLKAIEVIVNELQKLEEVDRQDVVSFALKQIGLAGTLPSFNDTTGIPSNHNAVTGNKTGLDLGIDRFVSNKKPKDQYQRVAVIAYYLEHKEKKKEFKNAEMAKANTLDARQPRIANIADVIIKAQNRYKFLTKGMGAATHQLSTLGADIVEALPDQEKVKQMMAGARTRPLRRKKKIKK